jgi:hypothetical protein
MVDQRDMRALDEVVVSYTPKTPQLEGINCRETSRQARRREVEPEPGKEQLLKLVLEGDPDDLGGVVLPVLAEED